jgi:glutamate--cysteine ligase catalytic subunit
MGLLSLGTPLSWKDTKKLADHIRSHGITQFLHTWDRLKDRRGDELFWGDEVLKYGFNWDNWVLTMP